MNTSLLIIILLFLRANYSHVETSSIRNDSTRTDNRMKTKMQWFLRRNTDPLVRQDRCCCAVTVHVDQTLVGRH